MYGAYTYASKRDLLDWVAGLLEMTVDSLDDVRPHYLIALKIEMTCHNAYLHTMNTGLCATWGS